jgi:hypothetical protein
MADPQLPPTQPEPASNTNLIAPVGILVAGLVGLIGSVLPWVSVTMSVPGGSQSIDSPSVAGPGDGPWRGVATPLSAILLVTAAGYLFGRRNRGLLGVATVFALLVLGVGTYKIVDVYQKAQDEYRLMDEAFARLPAAARGPVASFSELFHINPATGLWMVAIGGLFGTVLALVQLLRAPKPVAAEGWLQPIPAPPSALRPVAPASEEGNPPTA